MITNAIAISYELGQSSRVSSTPWASLAPLASSAPLAFSTPLASSAHLASSTHLPSSTPLASSSCSWRPRRRADSECTLLARGAASSARADVCAARVAASSERADVCVAVALAVRKAKGHRFCRHQRRRTLRRVRSPRALCHTWQTRVVWRWHHCARRLPQPKDSPPTKYRRHRRRRRRTHRRV